MIYTIIGDPHVTPKSLDKAEILFDFVEEKGNPTIWLGDLLDTKELVRGKCLNLVIDRFKKSKLKHYVLVGNHDFFNLLCEEHSLESLKLLPNVEVVDKPIIFDNLVLIPYYHDLEKLRDVLTKYQDPNKTLFGHLEVSSFDFGNGHMCTSGITSKDLKGFKSVISGHFHKYQKQGNLTYLGTPFSHSFGEANQDKFLGIYDSSLDKLELIETTFPKHLSIEHNCDTDHKLLIDKKEGFEKNHYRIILTGSEENINLFPKNQYENLDVKWISRPSDFAENNIVIEDTISNEKQFVQWALDVKGMNEDVIKLGLSILGACK